MDEPLSHQGGPAAWLAIRLYNEALRTDSSPLAMEGIVLEILAELFREPLLSRIPPQWLYRVKDLLHSHFAEPLTHAEIATTVGVHPVHLATTFRRHFMCTIGEYVRRLRFEFACREILVDRFSLSAIATCSGFFDQSHFIRIFKQFAGCTPSRFRANLHYT
jgi:AraC family transcriptional regulator